MDNLSLGFLQSRGYTGPIWTKNKIIWPAILNLVESRGAVLEIKHGERQPYRYDFPITRSSMHFVQRTRRNYNVLNQFGQTSGQEVPAQGYPGVSWQS